MIPELQYGELASDLITPPFTYPENITIENKYSVILEQAMAIRALHEGVQISVRTEDRLIEREDFKIPIRIYYPDGNGPFPVMLHYHGGGWCLCSIDTHDYQCRYYAKHGKTIVISVDYRLAPEYKFPVGLEDCYFALIWASKNAKSFDGDPSKMCVCGDSAGGNLAAAVAIMAKRDNGPQIRSQILVYPATDLSRHETISRTVYRDTLTLNSTFYDKCISMYVNNEEDLYNALVSPYYELSLASLPPVYMVVAECDLLADDCLAYARKLEKSGNEVKVKIYKSMPHGFFDYPYIQTFEAMDDINMELEKRLK